MSTNAQEVLNSFLNHNTQAEAFLNTYSSNDPATESYARNQAITLHYRELANDNNFSGIWFSLATLASEKVGEIIRVTSAMRSVGDTIGITQISAINEGLARGNQEVFKNMVSLEKVYQETGLKGLELLRNQLPKEGFTISSEVISAFTFRTMLEENAKKIAIEKGVGYRHPDVLKELYKDKENIERFKRTAILLTSHEQNLLQNVMYNEKFCDCSETIGEILSNKKHPMVIAISEKLGITEIEILTKKINFEALDITSLDDRMKYVIQLIDEIAKCQGNADAMEHLRVQRDGIVRSWYKAPLVLNAYKEIALKSGLAKPKEDQLSAIAPIDLKAWNEILSKHYIEVLKNQSVTEKASVRAGSAFVDGTNVGLSDVGLLERNVVSGEKIMHFTTSGADSTYQPSTLPLSSDKLHVFNSTSSRLQTGLPAFDATHRGAPLAIAAPTNATNSAATTYMQARHVGLAGEVQNTASIVNANVFAVDAKRRIDNLTSATSSVTLTSELSAPKPAPRPAPVLLSEPRRSQPAPAKNAPKIIPGHIYNARALITNVGGMRGQFRLGFNFG